MENPIKMDDLVVPLFLETPSFYFCNVYGDEKHATLLWTPFEKKQWKNEDVFSSPKDMGVCTCYLKNMKEKSVPPGKLS